MSLEKYFEDYNTCWVVTKDDEYKKIKRKLKREKYRVVKESVIIPEIKFYKAIYKAFFNSISHRFLPKYLRPKRFNLAGWYIQQLVKFGIAKHVDTEFYLTLDADVICLRSVTFDDLIQDGKGIVNTIDEDVHPEWYKSAERILGLKRSGLTHGVTPAILNREAVLSLQKYLNSRVNIVLRIISRIFSKESIAANLLINWRSLLIRNTPWTEYSLYHTFLEGMSLFEKYHIQRNSNAIYDRRHSLWLKEDKPNWEMVDKLDENAYFVVVQSSTKIPINEFYSDIEKHFRNSS
jgi:uncharacterized protein DUF6492